METAEQVVSWWTFYKWSKKTTLAGKLADIINFMTGKEEIEIEYNEQ